MTTDQPHTGTGSPGPADHPTPPAAPPGPASTPAPAPRSAATTPPSPAPGATPAPGPAATPAPSPGTAATPAPPTESGSQVASTAPSAESTGRLGRAARRARRAIPTQRSPQHLRGKESKRTAEGRTALRPAVPAPPTTTTKTDPSPAPATDTKRAAAKTTDAAGNPVGSATKATDAAGITTAADADSAKAADAARDSAASSAKAPAEPAASTAETATEPARRASTITKPAPGNSTKDDSTADAAEKADGSEAGSRKRKRPELPSTRPPGAPPDPWTAFAQTGERPPSRWRRGTRRAGRVLRHEYAIVIYGSLLLAVALTWPALRYPLHTVPQDIYDPARQAWQVAWAGHVLITEPARLWQGNAFFPEHYSYAFGDSLLGYAPFGILGSGPGAAILRYNILFVLAHALLAIGGYALIRQLGSGRTGAIVGAIAFAYAPWRLAQEGHLDIISAGGIPLALAMLLRGHGYSLRHGFRPERRRVGWAVAGWAVAIWQITLGFSLGLPFAYALLALALTTAIALLVRRLRQGQASAPGRASARGRAEARGQASARDSRQDARADQAERPTEAPQTPAARRTWGAMLPWRRQRQHQPAARTMQDTLVDQPGHMVVLRERPNLEENPANGATNDETAPAPAANAAERQPRGPVLGWRLLLTDLLGFLIMAGVGALIALPYLRVGDTAPAGTEISFFSPPVQSLLIGPAESRIWGAAHADVRNALAWPAEMSLLPGFALYALALAGLVFSVWRWWQRLVLLAGAVVTTVLALGTTVFDGKWTYLPLFGHFPSSLGLRIPGRLMLWVTLLLAILAAGAVAEFVRRVEQFAASRRFPPWPGPWLRLATFVPILLVAVEGWNATAHPVVPAQPAAMRTVSGPMLVLPTAELSDQTIMLWSTSRFQQVANGSGGFAPARQVELRRAVAGFPDAASIDYLRKLGIGTVLLLRPQAVGTPWERAGDLPVDNFGITRQDLDENAVIFRLDS